MAGSESMVVMNGTQVSYIGHDCEDIPEFLGERYGRLARRLDLSFNRLRRKKVRLLEKEQSSRSPCLVCRLRLDHHGFSRRHGSEKCRQTQASGMTPVLLCLHILGQF
ncbi:hypothetical protein AAFF_G00139600 [Aldrovandia affinis]|uniref:Uncharacterized protein n=1 Tax=Aldrovandia affinis TaxID=143900 RepID=A0AAD7TDL5_9TELE|nr:hypothetical protein AAFF_G00139600 [Aldrovandia affinis]